MTAETDNALAFNDGIYGLAITSLGVAETLATSDLLGAAIHARLAAACFAFLGWEQGRSGGATASPEVTDAIMRAGAETTEP